MFPSTPPDGIKQRKHGATSSVSLSDGSPNELLSSSSSSSTTTTTSLSSSTPSTRHSTCTRKYKNDEQSYLRLPIFLHDDEDESNTNIRRFRHRSWRTFVLYKSRRQSHITVTKLTLFFSFLSLLFCFVYFIGFIDILPISIPSLSNQVMIFRTDQHLDIFVNCQINIHFPTIKECSTKSSTKNQITFLPLQRIKVPQQELLPDYGTISYKSLNTTSSSEAATIVEFKRQILLDDEERAGTYRDQILDQIDASMSKRYYTKEDREDEKQECYDPSWTGQIFVSCNQIHEVVLIERTSMDGINNDFNNRPSYQYNQDYNVTYLRHGMYRDAWRLQRPNSIHDDFVVKRYMIHKELKQKDMLSIQKEAIIMERLTGTPRILDIYGYCGSSVLIETMDSEIHTTIVEGEGLTSQIDLDKLDNIYPRNNLTASEKLQISLSMAESLVDLHEYKEGTIVHSDTHIEQWLLAPDKTLKLNDFNNAQIRQWNIDTQQYCDRYSYYGGVYRAPEEYFGKAQDETKDIFSFGNNVYTLLTGLWPFYNEEYRRVKESEIQQQILDGKRPFIDDRYRTRTFIEGMLVEIMEACWAGKRKDRPSMSFVADFLKNVKLSAWKKGELESSTWIDIPMPE